MERSSGLCLSVSSSCCASSAESFIPSMTSRSASDRSAAIALLWDKAIAVSATRRNRPMERMMFILKRLLLIQNHPRLVPHAHRAFHDALVFDRAAGVEGHVPGAGGERKI